MTLKQLDKLVKHVDFENIDFYNHKQVVNTIKQIFSINKKLEDIHFLNCFRTFDKETFTTLSRQFKAKDLANFEAVRLLTICYNLYYNIYESDYKIFYENDEKHINIFMGAIE